VNVRSIKEHQTLVAVYAILVLLVVVASLASDPFLTARNVKNILRQAVPLGIVSIGQTLVILVGGIDLSVGSVISLTTCLTAGLMLGRDAMAIPVIAFVIALGILIGFFNGLIIVKTRISPLIVTLGMMSIVQGVVFMYTDAAYGEISPCFSFFAWEDVGFIPFPFLILAATGAAGVILLRMTTFGTYLYAIGGSEHTARLSGISVDRCKVLVYTICGFTAALTGLYLVSRMGMGDPWTGERYMIDSLVPVLIGGTLLGGGRGGLIGTFAGILILSVLSNVFNLLNVSAYWQWVIEGVIIVIAVAFYGKRINSFT
jgi:ribose transport system permease protein